MSIFLILAYKPISVWHKFVNSLTDFLFITCTLLCAITAPSIR